MNATFSEQIHLYYEGLLPEYAEAALFAELSSNSDLRMEMNMQLKLLNAAKKHAAAIQAPTDAKNMIFARLGLKIPSEASSTLASGGALQHLPVQHIGAQIPTNVVQSSVFTLLASLFSSITTAAIILLLFQSGWMFGGGGKSNSGNGTIPPIQEYSTLAASSNNRAFVPHDTIHETKTIVRYLPVNQAVASDVTPNSEYFSKSLPVSSESRTQEPSASTVINTLGDRTNATDTQEMIVSSEKAPMQEEFHSTKPVLSHDEQEDLNIATPLPQKERSRIGIIAEVRGVRSRSIPESNLSSETYPIFNNTAFSLRMPLSPASSIGVEIGQEAYSLRYQTQLSEYDYLVNIEKNPVFLWAGLTYRHTFLPNDLFSPILSVTLGGTSIGAMGRTLLGLQYSIDTKTRCTLGVEASSLLYIHWNIWNFSPNVGISYGISFEL